MTRSMGSQITARFLVTVGFLLLLGGCGIGSAPTLTLRTLATFQSSGDATTVLFTTRSAWVLAWTCDPYVQGVVAPYSLTVTVKTPSDNVLGTHALDTECNADNMHGNVGVRQTGEQWLTIGTGGTAGPWTVTVEVAASDTSAEVLPTPLPTPGPPTPTPLPTPVALPLTFSGSGDLAPTDARPFTTSVSWHLQATCQGSPDTITDMNIYRINPPNSSFPEVQVAQIDFLCDGHLADSNKHIASGFPAGTYVIEVVGAGNWTMAIQPE